MALGKTLRSSQKRKESQSRSRSSGVITHLYTRGVRIAMVSGPTHLFLRRSLASVNVKIINFFGTIFSAERFSIIPTPTHGVVERSSDKTVGFVPRS